MNRFRHSVFARSFLLPLALLLWLSACHKWVELQPPYGPAIEASGSNEFRLTVAGDGAVIKSPITLQGDTLWAGALSIPLGDLERVEARKTDVLAIAAIVGASVGLVILSWSLDPPKTGW